MQPIASKLLVLYVPVKKQSTGRRKVFITNVKPSITMTIVREASGRVADSCHFYKLYIIIFFFF